MSTHGSMFSIRKDACQPRRVRCAVLGVLLVTVLLLLFPSSFVFASTSRAVTLPRAFTPPTQINVALDEVSIVRLIALYSGSGTTSTLCTGLGVIVASWPQANPLTPTPTEPNNLILTSGSVVSNAGIPCVAASGTAAKQFTLKSLQIIFNTQFNDSKTPYSETRTNLKASDIQCADTTSCSAGMTLFSLATKFANPFVTVAGNRDALQNSSAPAQSVQLALAKSGDNAFLPQTDAALSNATEVQGQGYRTTVSEYLNTLVVNPTTAQGEAGLLTIDALGNAIALQLTGNSVADQTAISKFLSIQKEWVADQNQWNQQDANTVQASWRMGNQQYYQQKNYRNASAAFAAAQLNTNFVGTKEFATIAARQATTPIGGSGKPNQGAGSSPSSTTIFGIKIPLTPMWLAAIGVVVLLVVLLVILLVVLLIRRNRSKQADREPALSPDFKRDWEAAQKEVWQKQQSGQLEQAGQTIQQFSPAQPYAPVNEVTMQQGAPQVNAETPVQSLTPAQALAHKQAQYANQPTFVDNSATYSSSPHFTNPPTLADKPTLVDNSGFNPSLPPLPASMQQSPVLQPSGPYSIPEPIRYEMEDQTVQTGSVANGQTGGTGGGIGQQKNLGFVSGIRTNPGIKRKYKPNEDSMFAAQGVRNNRTMMQPFGLFVVADGMGGHANGQDASRLAIQTITNYILPILLHNSELNGDGLKELLREGVQKANQAVHKHNMEQRADMGTTMTAALVVDTTAYVANVGDSRTYLYREGVGLSKITQDHSVVASLVDAGIIKPDDIYTHPKRNQIYRSLGEKPIVEVDAFKQDLFKGDKLLLCSDGLWDMVRDPQIASLLQHPVADLGKTGDALIDAALNGGGDDNVSVIVVQVTDPANPHDLALDVQFLYSPDTYVTPQL